MELLLVLDSDAATVLLLNMLWPQPVRTRCICQRCMQQGAITQPACMLWDQLRLLAAPQCQLCGMPSPIIFSKCLNLFCCMHQGFCLKTAPETHL